MLDALGFSSPSASTTSVKRKASDEHRGRPKRARYDAEAYRNAPYRADDSACFVDDKYLATGSKTKTKSPVQKTAPKEVAEADLPELSTEESDGRIAPQASPPTSRKVTAAPKVRDFAAKPVEGSFATATSSKHSSAVPEAKPFANTIAPRPILTAKKPKLVTTTPIPKPARVTLSPGAEELKWNDTMSSSEKWSSNPNKRALELTLGVKFPRRKILYSLKEPEYVCRDAEIRDGLWSIMDLLERFSKEFFAFEVQVGSTVRLPENFFKQFSADSAKVIGCVASGGPAGVQGWHDLFIDAQKRRAVAMAVVGNVLVEQVFGHLFFGGTDDQIEHITGLQDVFKDEDGKLDLFFDVYRDYTDITSRFRPQHALRNIPALRAQSRQD